MNPTPTQANWRGNDLVLTRDDSEVDRLDASQIERVILVCRDGATPGDLAFALIETAQEHLLLPASTGIAGCIHFERQSFWAARPCIYWVDERRAPLPRRLRPGLWLLRRQRPAAMRLPRAELDAVVQAWPLDGPMSWEQRKWRRIEEGRALSMGTPPR